MNISFSGLINHTYITQGFDQESMVTLIQNKEFITETDLTQLWELGNKPTEALQLIVDLNQEEKPDIKQE